MCRAAAQARGRRRMRRAAAQARGRRRALRNRFLQLRPELLFYLKAFPRTAARALMAPFCMHCSYPSSHTEATALTSSATLAAAPGDAPLTRTRRVTERGSHATGLGRQCGSLRMPLASGLHVRGT